ncbi:transcriptional regulator [Streptococcus infantarius subsp. infantarius]|uniref:helix-turn-helix transcriptional regulator n=1 Tax=Streptococcus infantarius TaxID=102684 RepID=UPI001BDB1503|nr:helix-turn-helix transcriptional regulator [Streptococcus infantarius]MBT0904541.1 helix-turn-helix domain-containing protein [Streptococcus infantarius subsp. infantarius]MBT0918453.1 helix-turn-helix domain-containing protein [Streptococcus infantarius subsp. infantarius]MBT0932358.1 helix-turn-helix domain-containing protein [Streptococcus infantarius subsp. infantarius]MCO4577371.1 transcriptional regulator [Streptococcus infantarius subsp. infantarius]MCO4580476.1 transcriptional regul
MNISELRKQYQMSQDDFANIFHVSRQTVSNWENGKSYPDVEMLVKISDYFGISVDQLIKKETIPSVAKNSDKQKKLWPMLAVIATAVCLIGAFFLYNYNEEHSVKFSMKKDKTYAQSATSQKTLEVAKGYFTLPEDEKLNLKVNGMTDDGDLHLSIVDENNKCCYQLGGDELKDSQKLYFKKGSYQVQITANHYHEKVVSLDYNVSVKG